MVVWCSGWGHEAAVVRTTPYLSDHDRQLTDGDNQAHQPGMAARTAGEDGPRDGVVRMVGVANGGSSGSNEINGSSAE